MTRIAVWLVLTACFGKAPTTRYYQLAEPKPTVTQGGAAAIAIEPLATDAAYDDERIVYRLTPYRLDYYDYHRWTSSPGTLIANYLERAFEHSGRFSAVTREANTNVPVVLTGRVVAMEEVDLSKTKWVGRIVLELALTDRASGRVLWSEQYEETEPMAMQSPEGLAQALSVALGRITLRLVPIVSVLAADSVREAAELKSLRRAHR